MYLVFRSLLDKICASDDAKLLGTAVYTDCRRLSQGSKGSYKTTPRKPHQVCWPCRYKSLPKRLCRFSGKTTGVIKSTQIVGILEDDSEAYDEANTNLPCRNFKSVEHNSGAVACRVQARQPRYMDAFHSHHVIRVTIDSGATGNMIRHSTVKRFGSQIVSCTQSVHKVDDSS